MSFLPGAKHNRLRNGDNGAAHRDEMITKDKWVTEEQVAAECEKLVAEGIALEAINANMIIDRLKTKGRGTVYKYVGLWRDRRARPTVLSLFNLSPEMTQKVVALFAAMVGEAVASERQAAVDKVATADQRVALLEEQVRDLLETLDATERERDEANEQSMKLSKELNKAVIAAEAQLKIAQEAKADREAIYAQYLPWLLANGHPDSD